MKKQLKALLLVTLLASYCLPIWSQSSTEGKEFWVALNMTTGTAGGDHAPFICITTQHPGGTYTITNPADPSFNTITGPIPLTGYIKIKASTSPGPNDIDLSKWYPQGGTAPSMSCQIKNVGLKVTTTVESSVYAGNMLPQSFDAANILPITALLTDYITQDYPGYDHGGTSLSDGGFPVLTILATENNTQVTVNPSSTVLNNNGTAPIVKTLNAGQVLYITGENRATLSGSSVTSDKKIAVFTGVNNTDVPGPKSARDHLYEQNMPVDYWGTHFVVTRSMKKDANRIRVTAKENGTIVFVDGFELATINSGETYEFELCSPEMRAQSPYTSAVGEGRGTKFYFDGPAHYLETSCPCAVFSYDVSETYYISNGTSERDPNAHGDPSMVWISPLEQQLRKITFGVMNTDKTTAHYVNVITPTEGASSLEVREVAMNAGQVVYGNNMVNPADVQPVPSNPAYSYARVKLTENKESVYTITSGTGFIGHVYGSGDKESYAYSCGSAAVQQGVKVDGEIFTNGFRSDNKFCLNTDLTFDSKVGTDEITRVDWDFGDGTTEYQGLPEFTHRYTSPGWYDVTANLYGHQVCTDESDVPLGSVHFSFRVVRPDTIVVAPERQCLTIRQQDSILTNYGQSRLDSLTTFGERKILNPDAPCYEDKQMSLITYGLETERVFDSIVTDGAEINGKWYDTDAVISWSDTLPFKCPQHYTCSLKVITCLKMTVDNDSAKQNICPGEDLNVAYTKTKGDIESARFVIAGIIDTEIIISNDNTQAGTITLPVADITTPGIYKGRLIVKDAYEECDFVDLPFDIDITVKYPNDIFLYKFYNVLAVYKKGYGGNDNYDFKNYEWHVLRNGQDSLLSAGENESVLYLGEGNTFEIGDQVYVVLTDMRGVAIPSCSQTITKVDDYTIPDPEQAPARKMLQQNRFMILKGDKTYDIYGQKVR